MSHISEILAKVQFNGTLFLNGRFGAPWCVGSPPSADLAERLERPNSNVIVYHLVTDGKCVVAIDKSNYMEVEPGEVVVFPTAAKHAIGSHINAIPANLPANLKDPDLTMIEHGGVHDQVRLICGWLTMDQHLFDPMFDALPDMFKIDIRERPSGQWLESSIEQAVAMSQDQDSASLKKLAELLFIEAVQGFSEALPEWQNGWLAATRDQAVGRAIQLIHDNPAQNWTVAELASNVGSSRSSFTQKFNELIGMPPMTYVSKWRLAQAAALLKDGRNSIAQIVGEVGYESEASFSRAFKREFGKPPASWRRQYLH